MENLPPNFSGEVAETIGKGRKLCDLGRFGYWRAASSRQSEDTEARGLQEHPRERDPPKGGAEFHLLH